MNLVYQNVIKLRAALSLLLSDFDPEYATRNTRRKSGVNQLLVCDNNINLMGENNNICSQWNRPVLKLAGSVQGLRLGPHILHISDVQYRSRQFLMV
jgi:hypothetical protein